MCPGRGPYEFEDPRIFVQETLSTKPEFLKDDNFVNDLYDQIQNKPTNTFTFVQFTDAHLDLDYKAGTLTACR